MSTPTSALQSDVFSCLNLKSPSRFNLSSVHFYAATHQGEDNRTRVGKPDTELSIQGRPVLSLSVDKQTSNVTALRNDDRLVEFVLDETGQLMLKVPYAPVIAINFRLQLLVTPSNSISNLTFVSTGSVKHLDSFIKNEFFHNPNIQKNDNVVLLGDYNAEDSDHPQMISIDFVWQCHAPQEVTADKGYRTVVCFAEYDKKEHALQQLATMTVYIDGPPPYLTEHMPVSMPWTAASATKGSPLPAPLVVDPGSDSRVFKFSPDVPFSPVFTRSEAAREAAPFPAVLSPTELSPPTGSLSGMLDAGPENIDQVLQTEKKSMIIPRPDGDSTVQPEDGPLFRATISSLEKKTAYLKSRVKKLLKRSILIYERQMALVEAQMLFVQALEDLAKSEIPAFEPLLYHYFDRAQLGGEGGVIEFNRQCAFDMNLHVIEPLKRLYEHEIKLFDFRKRQFDDESSQYYSWLSRYLSMKQEAKGKKKLDGDSKYVEKRKAFELSRFDYYSYMQDLHGGRKQQEVTHQMALYAENESNRLIMIAEKVKGTIKPNLDSIVEEFKDANKDWSRQRTEREDRRRALERSIVAQGSDMSNAVSSTTPGGGPLLASSEPTNEGTQPVPVLRVNTQGLGVTPMGPRSVVYPTSASVGTMATTVPTNDSSQTATSDYDRDDPNELDELDDSLMSITTVSGTSGQAGGQGRAGPGTASTPTTLSTAGENDKPADRKEGLLWAMSRPGGLNDPIANLNKPGWHKFWVVLDRGKLCEYTNWKQGLDLHNEPINLNVALVREARNAERRFCFEVVTPNYKRVYQATSDDDMMSWIRAINNGISSSLENTSAAVRQPSKPSKIHRVFNRHDDGDARVGKLRVDNLHISDNDHKGGIERIGRKISLSKNRVSASSPVSTNVGSMHSMGKQLEKSGSPLLPFIQQLHSSNQQCADCGSTNKVEWISINLLAILCIECSGVHRSLGSHISKVRSLTLDTVSFNAELVELIQSVNNAGVNGIWEARLDKRPPITERNRRQFITEKYVGKKYVEELERPNAYLRRAVAERSVLNVLRALASRANPNSTVDPADVQVVGDGNKVESEPILTFALRTAPSTSRIFPIAELLILNSASLPSTPPVGLSPGAVNYLNAKFAREAGGPSFSLTDSSASPHGNANHAPVALPSSFDKETRSDPRRGLNNMGDKFHKRLSGF